MNFLSKHARGLLKNSTDCESGLTRCDFSDKGTLLGKEGRALKDQAWKEILDVLKAQASKFNVSLDLR